MSEKRDIKDYINDILESITDIREFTSGIAYEQFVRDKKTLKAVIKSIEVIGEASSNIPDEIRQKYPGIPWKELIGMRNRLIHEYAGVDNDIVWQSINEDLLPLEESVRDMRNDCERGKTQ